MNVLLLLLSISHTGEHIQQIISYILYSVLHYLCDIVYSILIYNILNTINLLDENDNIL